MVSVSTFDAPPQAQHNKLLAEFTAQDRKDPQKLLAALEALDQKVLPQSPGPNTLSDNNASPVLKLNMAERQSILLQAILLVQQNKATAAVKILEPLFEHIEPMQEQAAVRVCILLMELYLANRNFAQAAKVLHYLETAYGVVSDSPEDKESIAGQNSDLDIGGDQSQSGLDLTDPPRPPSSGPSEPPRPPSRGAADPPRPPSRGGESSRLTDNPPPGFGGPPDPFTSPSKPDSTGSGVTEEGEIAAVLSRMLDQAGRMDAQAVAQGNRFMEVGGVAVVQLVRILRARLNLALNQLRPARRDIKAILAADPNSPQGISLKAQLELQRQSYRKAARILTISPATPAPEGTTPSPGKPTPNSKAPADKATSSLRAAPGQPSQQDGAKHITMLSNMGCVQHTLGKSNTAALCFAQALRTCAQTPVLEQAAGGSGGVVSHNAHLHITYSAGVQALQLGKYSTALRCFQDHDLVLLVQVAEANTYRPATAAGFGPLPDDASRRSSLGVSAAALYDQPLLWMRMADCCLAVLQPPSPTSPPLTPETHAVAIATGAESWRQVVQHQESSDANSDGHMAAMCQRSISRAQDACQLHHHADNMSSSQQHEDSGEWDGMSRICSFATQCLHNTIFLCDQALPQPTEPSSSHQAPIISAESSEALPNPSSALPNPSSGPQYPSNGHRGRLGTAEGSAAEAAEQLAMLSLDRSRASSGAMDAAVVVAEATHRQQLHTIKAAALVNLTYLQLQQQQWQQAVVYSQQLLQLPGVPSDQQLLAHCYAAEALCNLQSPDEAAQQLQTAVALQACSGTDSVQQAGRASGDAGPATDSQESKQAGGASHALQVAVLVNAASMQANQGHLQPAHDYAAKAMELQPHSQQALLALVYVELCKGNCNAALTLLKQQHVQS
ncbi:hypothetical protein ABBQ32_003354 [Trebouxia sp. C0010 RCD-2024]